MTIPDESPEIFEVFLQQRVYRLGWRSDTQFGCGIDELSRSGDLYVTRNFDVVHLVRTVRLRNDPTSPTEGATTDDEFRRAGWRVSRDALIVGPRRVRNVDAAGDPPENALLLDLIPQLFEIDEPRFEKFWNAKGGRYMTLTTNSATDQGLRDVLGAAFEAGWDAYADHFKAGNAG